MSTTINITTTSMAVCLMTDGNAANETILCMLKHHLNTKTVTSSPPPKKTTHPLKPEPEIRNLKINKFPGKACNSKLAIKTTKQSNFCHVLGVFKNNECTITKNRNINK